VRAYVNGMPSYEGELRGAYVTYSFSTGKYLQNPVTWSIQVSSTTRSAWINGTFHLSARGGIAGQWMYPRREHTSCGDWVDAVYIVPEEALRRKLIAFVYVDGMLMSVVTPTKRRLTHRVATVEARAYRLSVRWMIEERLQVPRPFVRVTFASAARRRPVTATICLAVAVIFITAPLARAVRACR
jgi:hypothetical protein